MQLTDKQIWKLEEEVKQYWYKLSIDYQNMLINGENAETARGGVNVQRDRLIWDKIIKNVSDATKLTVQEAGNLLRTIIGAATKTPVNNTTNISEQTIIR